MTQLLLLTPISPARYAYHPGKDQRRSLAWLLPVVLVGWLVRLIVVALVYRQFLDPARDHWEFAYEIGRVARSIALGQGFSDPYWAHTGPTALLTPVYPYLLASVFAVFGVFTKASALVFLALNTFFSAITSIPIYLIARRSTDTSTAKTAAWLWAFFPYAINFSATTMWYHSFVALLLALIFLLVLSLATSERLLAWVGFGVLLGFAALTNPVMIMIAPVTFFWLWVQWQRKHKRAGTAVAFGVIAMVVTIAPWPLRNQRVLHQPVIFKDGFWLEVCVGNANDSLHWWDGIEHPSGSVTENTRYERLGELRYMAAKRSQATTYIATHPVVYGLRSLRHAFFMWTGFWSLNPDYLRQEPFDPENICFLSLLSLLSIIGLRFMFLEGRGTTAALYLMVLVSFPLPYFLSHLDPGFRHPVDPLLVVLASFAIRRLQAKIRLRRVIRKEMAQLALH